MSTVTFFTACVRNQESTALGCPGNRLPHGTLRERSLLLPMSLLHKNTKRRRPVFLVQIGKIRASVGRAGKSLCGRVPSFMTVGTPSYECTFSISSADGICRNSRRELRHEQEECIDVEQRRCVLATKLFFGGNR